MTARRSFDLLLVVAPLAVFLALAAPPKRPLDRAAAKWVDQTLGKMTLDEKIGQLLVTSLNASFTSADSDAYDKLRHLVRDVKVGGIHVFGGTEAFPAVMLNPTYGTGGAPRQGEPFAAPLWYHRPLRRAA